MNGERRTSAGSVKRRRRGQRTAGAFGLCSDGSQRERLAALATAITRGDGRTIDPGDLVGVNAHDGCGTILELLDQVVARLDHSLAGGKGGTHNLVDRPHAHGLAN